MSEDYYELRKEIEGARDQSEVFNVVEKFDDGCNLDLNSDIYTGSDMVDNIYNYDYYGDSKKVQREHYISSDVIKEDKRTLDRLGSNDYPEGFDMFFYQDGEPVELGDLKDDALSLLDENY